MSSGDDDYDDVVVVDDVDDGDGDDDDYDGDDVEDACFVSCSDLVGAIHC